MRGIIKWHVASIDRLKLIQREQAVIANSEIEKKDSLNTSHVMLKIDSMLVLIFSPFLIIGI